MLGHYQYNIMADGLTNAPSFFQSFMNYVFRDMIQKFVIVSIDDILSYCRNLAEHLSHIREILRHVLDHG